MITGPAILSVPRFPTTLTPTPAEVLAELQALQNRLLRLSFAEALEGPARERLRHASAMCAGEAEDFESRMRGRFREPPAPAPRPQFLRALAPDDAQSHGRQSLRCERCGGRMKSSGPKRVGGTMKRYWSCECGGRAKVRIPPIGNRAESGSVVV